MTCQHHSTANWQCLQTILQWYNKTNHWSSNKRPTKLPWRTIPGVLKMETYPKSYQKWNKVIYLQVIHNSTLEQINNQQIFWNNNNDSVKYLWIHEKLPRKIRINKKLYWRYRSHKDTNPISLIESQLDTANEMFSTFTYSNL